MILDAKVTKNNSDKGRKIVGIPSITLENIIQKWLDKNNKEQLDRDLSDLIQSEIQKHQKQHKKINGDDLKRLQDNNISKINKFNQNNQNLNNKQKDFIKKRFNQLYKDVAFKMKININLRGTALRIKFQQMVRNAVERLKRKRKSLKEYEAFNAQIEEEDKARRKRQDEEEELQIKLKAEKPAIAFLGEAELARLNPKEFADYFVNNVVNKIHDDLSKDLKEKYGIEIPKIPKEEQDDLHQKFYNFKLLNDRCTSLEKAMASAKTEQEADSIQRDHETTIQAMATLTKEFDTINNKHHEETLSSSLQQVSTSHPNDINAQQDVIRMCQQAHATRQKETVGKLNDLIANKKRACAASRAKREEGHTHQNSFTPSYHAHQKNSNEFSNKIEPNTQQEPDAEARSTPRPPL